MTDILVDEPTTAFLELSRTLLADDSLELADALAFLTLLTVPGGAPLGALLARWGEKPASTPPEKWLLERQILP